MVLAFTSPLVQRDFDDALAPLHSRRPTSTTTSQVRKALLHCLSHPWCGFAVAVALVTDQRVHRPPSFLYSLRSIPKPVVILTRGCGLVSLCNRMRIPHLDSSIVRLGPSSALGERTQYEYDGPLSNVRVGHWASPHTSKPARNKIWNLSYNSGKPMDISSRASK